MRIWNKINKQTMHTTFIYKHNAFLIRECFFIMQACNWYYQWWIRHQINWNSVIYNSFVWFCSLNSWIHSKFFTCWTKTCKIIKIEICNHQITHNKTLWFKMMLNFLKHQYAKTQWRWKLKNWNHCIIISTMQFK